MRHHTQPCQNKQHYVPQYHNMINTIGILRRKHDYTNGLHVIPYKILFCVKGSVKLSSASGTNFVTQSPVMQLLDACKRQRFVVDVELIGEELWAMCELQQISNAKDADHTDTLSMARPVKHPITPVLEPCEESIPDVVCLWFTCRHTALWQVTNVTNAYSMQTFNRLSTAQACVDVPKDIESKFWEYIWSCSLTWGIMRQLHEIFIRISHFTSHPDDHTPVRNRYFCHTQHEIPNEKCLQLQLSDHWQCISVNVKLYTKYQYSTTHWSTSIVNVLFNCLYTDCMVTLGEVKFR